MSEALCLATFRSIHHVMKAEELLKARGLWTDMIPNPRAITADCGMALVLHCSDVPEVRSLLGGDGAPSHIYRKSDSGFTPIGEEQDSGTDDPTH
jgi:hypothetical protein